MTMLSVVTKLPLEPTGKPPVIFVHGGGDIGSCVDLLASGIR